MSTFSTYVAENPDVVQQAQATFKEILDRSAQDMEFRARLLENPREALAEYHDGNWGDTEIVFVENKADATIVLPDPVDPEAELSDAELEAVAGGSTFPCGLVISALITTR